jgi:signal transduction histidine kinase
MMKHPFQVIHVEDSAADSELVHSLLLDNGLDCQLRRVESTEEFREALNPAECDLILSDCTLPHFSGLEALQIAREIAPDVPFIFVSGTIGEETAISSLHNGATDYVLKHHLSRLVPAVRRALTEAESRASRATLEAQLRQSHKLQTIGTLVGGLTHDFRNVLQILKLNLELLPIVANEPDQVLKIAEQMRKTTDRGCDMMKELLVFARKADAHLAPVDITGQIKETTQILRGLLPENITLFLHLESDLPPILADKSQIDRVLSNLVVNARDAMPEGGHIGIGVDVVRFGHEFANSWHAQDAPYLRIRVSDTGTGMDDATQAKIFEPFFTTKPAGKGTGLGLSVVFGLMEAHRGFIDLVSKPGEGTTFSLLFPLPMDAKVPAQVQEISPQHLLGNPAREKSE